MREFIAKLRTCLVEDTKECLLAWWRYTLYYSWWDGFLSKTIRDQFKWRMNIMEKACYENGSCQRCGCTTGPLQMADKSCDKPCYTPFMDKEKWDLFISGEEIVFIKNKIFTRWKYKRRVLENVLKGETMFQHNIFKNNKLVHSKLEKIDELEN